MPSPTTITEADILSKAIAPKKADLSPDTARSFLSFRFDAAATKRIRQLLQKNNRGTISANERLTLEKYLRVGQTARSPACQGQIVLAIEQFFAVIHGKVQPQSSCAASAAKV